MVLALTKPIAINYSKHSNAYILRRITKEPGSGWQLCAK